MRIINLTLVFLFLSISNVLGQNQVLMNTRGVVNNSIPSDNTLRYYRLAIPVTHSAYVEDLDENYNNVLQFWRECEEFVNRMFVPLGFCFDVVEDERLVKSDYFTNEENESFIYTLQANGTMNTNDLIGEDSYDVGMWVHHRDVSAENSGLSAEGGAYSSSAKGSGYSKTDKWVVAHELGHMFGAPHTTTGEGSLMDSGGDDFFSYPSIKKIRDLAVEKGAGSANKAVKVNNNTPVFVNANMKGVYKIPQGACLAIPVYVNDADGNMLTYSAIGCSSSTVGNVTEGGYMPHFASLLPQEDNVLDYRPKFTADIFYDDFYYEQSGTNIPAMSDGSYAIAILVNDVPTSMEYDDLVSNPFYSNYAVWDATVQIVSGTPFNASMSPAKNSYLAGEQVTVAWGVNSDYFTTDSRLRITMSTDYGKTFAYVLADNVPALDGKKVVALPNVNVGNIDVDFKTAIRSMRGGIIRIEEIGGVAYTLTTLSPENGGGFNITGGGDEPMIYTISVTAGDGGRASVGGGTSANVTAGSSVTLTATPDEGYIFDGWYNDKTFVSTQAEYTFTPTASGTYNAQFIKETGTPVIYKITATANPKEGGTATVNGSASATVEANGTIELSAKANDGYTFVNWTNGDKVVTTQADFKIYNVAGDADYVANFLKETGTPVTYKITATANPIKGGTATVNGSASATVEANGTIELLAKANDGYTFVNWTNGGKEVTTQADFTIYNVAGDADYIANFKLESTVAEYPNPEGKSYEDNYLTLIETTGGDTNINYTASEHPGSLLVVVPGKVQLEKGQSFTINLVAKSLGESSYNFIREDIRYCHASLFTDFDRDFRFEEVPVKTWGKEPPVHNVYGNYDDVMNITHTITVPDDASSGESRIRMIYTNAWKAIPTYGTAELDKGIVYDIVVEVVDKVSVGYYKFKNVDSEKYLTSKVNAESGNRLVMGGDDNIFYYDQSSLLSYTEGLYVGIAQTGDMYNVTLGDVAAAPVAAKVTSSADTYYISLGSKNDYGNGIRYIYGNAGEVDSETQDKGFPVDKRYQWEIEALTVLPVEIGKIGWATIYAPVALKVPTGVEAYYIEKEKIEDDNIILTEIPDSVIPASMGAILFAKDAVGNGKVYDFEITESSSSYDTNILEGSIANKIVSSEAYVLSEMNGEVGLYKAKMNMSGNSAFLNNAHKAYLPIIKLSTSQLGNGWRFVFDGDESTAVDEIRHNIHNQELYDLTGRKIKSTMHRGVYISNGKKIYVR